jgi:putative ABC transport system ATP-binding protein
MIKTVNLSKIFRTEEIRTTAIDMMNIEVKQGEFLAIMGPSGCGKSTLLNIIGLLDAPTSGEYFFEGVDVADFREDQRNNLRKGNIGFIFQNFNLIDELNVYENVELPLLALKVKNNERKNKVEEILERMEIANRRKYFPHQLSGGQQQRVAVSRAVITQPKLILADEPTGNLDSANGEEVMQLLGQINKEGSTIIMVTHSTIHAEKAHRVIHLLDGHIVAEQAERYF